jgi:hypothetical protein
MSESFVWVRPATEANRVKVKTEKVGDVELPTYVQTDGDGALISGTNPLPVTYGDSAALDSFQRLRVGTPAGVFENKNIHSRQKSQWEEPINGAIIVHGTVTGGPFQVGETITGGTSGISATVTIVSAGSLTYNANHNDFEDAETITGGTSGATAAITTHGTGSDVYHDRNTASVILKIGDSAGDKAVRQTHRYFSYVPGKSHEIWATFIWGVAGEVSLVRRTSTSGSAVDVDDIPQSEWNVDPMDGTGPSGIKLDFTKEVFMTLDLQWQGDGRVRFGFFYNGCIIYAHKFLFSGTLDAPYMSTPSLPIKHEIENINGTTIERRSGYFNGDNGLFLKQVSTDADKTMKEVCTAIVSIGGQNPVGLGFSVSNEVTARTINNGAEAPILAVRLKNTHPNGGVNRVTLQLSDASFFPVGNSAHFDVIHAHDPTGITATWTDVGGGSAAEFSTDISAITGTPSHKIIQGYAGAGAAGKGAQENARGAEKTDQHRFVSQNFDSTNSQVFIILGEAITGNATAFGHLAWIEFD